MNTVAVPRTTIAELADRHAVLLLDAYGVLITHDGPLPDAGALIDHLNATHTPYFILTNDASRSPKSSSARYRSMGLVIPADRIITSGLLIAPYFRKHRLEGARCVVLGPEDSLQYVRDAQGIVVDPKAADQIDVLVLCDEHGYPFLETADRVLTLLYRTMDRGTAVRLLLPNPDLVYPAGPGRYGFTAGAMARMFEAALGFRYANRDDLDDLRFVPLGKPHPPIFEEAERRAGTRDMVMIGDQADTDIQGANTFGIPSALVTTGLTRLEPETLPPDLRPTYLLDSLKPPKPSR